MRQQIIRDFGKNIDDKEILYAIPKERVKNNVKDN